MTHSRKWLRAAVLCAAAVLTLAAPAAAQRGNRPRDIPPPRAHPQFLAAFRKATAEASKATVRVLCDGKEAALGTVVGPDGWILTKYSLLSGKVACKTKDGKTLPAKVVGVHEPFDLAMLKVEATDLPAVTFTDSKAAPVGNWLVSPGTGADPVTVGVMSVAARTPPPVVARGPRRPINVRPNTDYLGLYVTPDGKAVKVRRVAFQSAAAKAGVKADDRILSIQGTAVTDQSSLLALLGKMKPGDLVTIKLVRSGKELELKAKLEQRGRRGRRDQNLMGSELSQKRTGFPTYFQSDAVIKPKDCGGPVCDLEGRVLGINIARAGRVESYAVPTEALTPLLADLMSGNLSPKRVAAAALKKKITELKAALKKVEEERAAAEKILKEAKDALKKQEADRAAAEKKFKEARDALDKAEKELKDKK
jgi:serine protease Do